MAESEGKTKPKRKGRRIVIIVAICLVGLVVAALVAGYFLRTPLANWAASKFLPEVERSTGLKIAYKAIEITPTLGVRIVKPRITAANQVLVTADKLRVGVSLLALLTGKIVVSNITLTKPEIDATLILAAVARLAGGPKKPPKKPGKKEEWSVKISRVKIVDGRIRFPALPAPLGWNRAEKFNLNARVTASSTEAGTPDVRIRIKRMSANFGPKTFVLKSLTLEAAFGAAGLAIQGMALETPKSTIKLKAAVKNLLKPRIAIVLELDPIDQSDIAFFVKKLPPWLTKNPLTARLKVVGPLGNLKIGLTVKTGPMTVKGKGTADLSRPKNPGYDLVFDITGLPLRSIVRTYVPRKYWPAVPVPHQTTARITVKGRGLGPPRIDTRTMVRIDPGVLYAKAAIKNKLITFKPARTNLGWGSFAASGRITNFDYIRAYVNGTVRKIPNVYEVRKMMSGAGSLLAGSTLPAPIKVAGPIVGPLTKPRIGIRPSGVGIPTKLPSIPGSKTIKKLLKF